MTSPGSNLKKTRGGFPLRLFLLLFGLSVSIVAAASGGENVVSEWGPFVVTAILLPMVWGFRKEQRDGLNELQSVVHTIALDVAVLKERDRIGELLDKRLPK